MTDWKWIARGRRSPEEKREEGCEERKCQWCVEEREGSLGGSRGILMMKPDKSQG